MTLTVAPVGFALESGSPLQRSLPVGRMHLNSGHNRQPRRHLPDDFADKLMAQSSLFAALGKSARDGSPLEIAAFDGLLVPVDVPEVDVADDGLEAPDAPLSAVDASRCASYWPGSVLSLFVHGALAAALVTYGLSLEMPAVEGEQIVSIVMLGDAPADDAAGDAAGPAVEATQTLLQPAGPQTREEEELATIVRPPEKMSEPETVIATPPPSPVAKHIFQPKPEMPAIAPMPLLSTQTPAKTSEPQPEVERLAEPAKPQQAPTPEQEKPALAKQEPSKPKQTPPPLKTLAKKPKPPEAAVAKKQPEKAKAVAKPTAKAEKAPAEKAKPDAKGDKSSAKTGSGKRDAKKGQIDGFEKGKAAKNSAGKASSGTGNANASNYPGLVQRKIARTRQKPSSGKGSVVVSFTVTASGSLAGVSVARSSGNSAADSAAVDHIRRSAPFPAPPSGAQTRFQIPVAIR